jgi:uncharacterized protein YjbI with pentapeptide repeats
MAARTASVRAAEKRAAQERARELLRGLLGVATYEQLQRLGYLEVASPSHTGRVYRIPRFPGMVSVYEHGVAIERLCVQPTQALPDDDLVVMHKLLIEADEQRYLATANHFAILAVAWPAPPPPPPRPLPAPAPLRPALLATPQRPPRTPVCRSVTPRTQIMPARPSPTDARIALLLMGSINRSGHALAGANLARGDLQGANLRRANLNRATLTKARLAGSDLQRGDLREADLREADLRGADLYGARLDGANLAQADLGSADARAASLAGANCSTANLRHADLRHADLRGADLHRADLRRANLCGARLDDALLAGARLTGARYDAATRWPSGVPSAALDGLGAVLAQT